MGLDFAILIIITISLILISVLLLLIIKISNILYLTYKNSMALINMYKYNIEPLNLTYSPDVKNLINLSVDIWKISRNINKDNDKLLNLIDRLNRNLDKFDIKVVDFTGQRINEDLNIKVLETKNDANLENNYVISTESPAIFYKDKMVQEGLVIINKI